MEELYVEKKKNKRNLTGRLKEFGGRMPEVIKKYIQQMDITIEGKPHCSYEDYKKIKSEATAGIGAQVKLSKRDMNALQKTNELRAKLVVFIKKLNEQYNIPKINLYAMVGIDGARVREWEKMLQNDDIPLAKPDFEGSKVGVYEYKVAKRLDFEPISP